MIRYKVRVAGLMLVVIAGIDLYVIARKTPGIVKEYAVLPAPTIANSITVGAAVQEPNRGSENNESESEYLLRTRGYPGKVSLSQAVEECNRRIQSTKMGKTQPPLTLDEVIAAIRDLKLGAEHLNPQMYKAIQDIAKSEMMPKGSYLYFTTGTVSYNGYDIDALRIYLRMGLDKYPEDVKGVPVYLMQIRSQYISSRPTNFPRF